ncbi:MAG: alpha/beta fold hydrolase [Gemmatimonadaceae bacterium]|nr:alpha/beta fold hydrolase [Gemmatimonadaceae bacterium]
MTRRLAAMLVMLALLAMFATLAPTRAFAQVQGGTARGSVDTDPAPSTRPPASMAEVKIPSHGARMNGIVYLAAGPGAHPVVIFLHGYPGNERNLDLAQAVRRAGYQAVYVDIRGMWGSGGTFSFGNGLEDADAVTAWVRDPAITAKYHFDVRRIAIVGHSFGGWLSLMTGSRQPPTVCVAGLAAWNIGWVGQRFRAHPDERASNLDYFRQTTDAGSGPVRGRAMEMVSEMATHVTDWNYLSRASGFRDRALLLVSATRDTPDEDVAMHRKMADAVRKAGGRHVTTVEYEDDHPFSSHRIALASVLTRWLDAECARAQTGR